MAFLESLNSIFDFNQLGLILIKLSFLLFNDFFLDSLNKIQSEGNPKRISTDYDKSKNERKIILLFFWFSKPNFLISKLRNENVIFLLQSGNLSCKFKIKLKISTYNLKEQFLLFYLQQHFYKIKTSKIYG